jgi:hypothetical protein
MGKASSNKKVARAASTGGGRTSRGRRPWLWYLTLAAFVALGTWLIVDSRDAYIAAQVEQTPPRLSDHWHMAYGIYVCDDFIPALTDKNNDKVGIHSHGDGLIHIHPTSKRASGANATLDRFMEEGDADVSQDRIKVPGDEWKNGDKCGDKKGEVVVREWTSTADEEGRLVKGDPGEMRLTENGVVTIAFVPEGTDIPKPPSVSNLANPVDLQQPGAVPEVPTVPGDGSTPAPADGTTPAPSTPPDGSTPPASTDPSAPPPAAPAATPPG